MTSRNSKCCIIPHVSGERQTVGHSRVMVSVGHSRVMVSVGHSRVMVSVGHSRVMVSRKGYPFPPLPPPPAFLLPFLQLLCLLKPILTECRKEKPKEITMPSHRYKPGNTGAEENKN